MVFLKDAVKVKRKNKVQCTLIKLDKEGLLTWRVRLYWEVYHTSYKLGLPGFLNLPSGDSCIKLSIMSDCFWKNITFQMLFLFLLFLRLTLTIL